MESRLTAVAAVALDLGPIFRHGAFTGRVAHYRTWLSIYQSKDPAWRLEYHSSRLILTPVTVVALNCLRVARLVAFTGKVILRSIAN